MKKIIFIMAFAGLTSMNSLHAQTTNPAPYCNASFDDAGGLFPIPLNVAIHTVSFGTLNNNSNAQYAAPHYVFYNNLAVANFVRGNSYPLNLNLKTSGAGSYGVWIDFNQNNTFENSEKVAGTSTTPIPFTGTTGNVGATVLIPATASLGNTRMRVRIVEDDFFSQGVNWNTLPCNLSTSPTDIMDFGETEDYLINLISSVGMENITPFIKISFYPNPACNTISLNQTVNAGLYNIYNLNGKLVLNGKLNATSQLIDISDLAEGVYHLELLENDQLLLQQKLVKMADN